MVCLNPRDSEVDNSGKGSDDGQKQKEKLSSTFSRQLQVEMFSRIIYDDHFLKFNLGVGSLVVLMAAGVTYPT